jgi:hypothetical protein
VTGEDQMTQERGPRAGRRGFLEAVGGLAAVSVFGGTNAQASPQTTGRASNAIKIQGARLPEQVLVLSRVEAPPKGSGVGSGM